MPITARVLQNDEPIEPLSDTVLEKLCSRHLAAQTTAGTGMPRDKMATGNNKRAVAHR
jgi:hypothetical protein